MDKIALDKKENSGWFILAEDGLREILDNKKDEEVWGKYLF
ncbi:MAG: hypothetical protein AABX66_01085 [Nanoarchaeota archaeon]